MRKRLVSVLAVSAMVFAACGGTQATASPAASSAASPGGSTAASVAPTSAAPASADFKFAVDGEPTYFSLAYTDLPTSWIVGLIYTGMYRADNKLSPTPDMATALPDVSSDGLTWTVKLKTGIKWQDGSDFTSDDVKFTFDLALSKNCTYIPSFCGDAALNLDSVTAPDPDDRRLQAQEQVRPVPHHRPHDPDHAEGRRHGVVRTVPGGRGQGRCGWR